MESDLAVLANRLAVLQGQAPDGSPGPTGENLPDLPPPPRTGRPVLLIQRRPDLLRSSYEIRASDADLAAALRDRLPRLNLNFSSFNTEDEISRIFDNWLATLAADLAAPLIDGGRRRAEVARTRARREELLADYRQAVLVALREVEDNLARERQQGRQIDEIRGQLDLANRSSRQLLREYLNGAGTFLEVLDSLTREQELRRQLVTARQTRIEFRIALHRALAGGSFQGAGARARSRCGLAGRSR